MRRGVILIEACVACLILAMALTAVMPLFILSLRADVASQRVAVAVQLSNELLEEVLLRKWDHNTPRPSARAEPSLVLGPESPKDASDKRTFDDVDDFNGWSEKRPLDPVMRPLEGFEGYSRTVAVTYVSPDLDPSTSPTDFKRVEVCTAWPQMKPVCLDTLVTNR